MQYCNCSVFFSIVRNSDGDHEFWNDFRRPVSEADTKRLLDSIMESEDAPSASDAALPSPVPMQHATDRLRDSELANAVSTTEIMIADFYKKGHLKQRTESLKDELERRAARKAAYLAKAASKLRETWEHKAASSKRPKT